MLALRPNWNLVIASGRNFFRIYKLLQRNGHACHYFAFWHQM